MRAILVGLVAIPIALLLQHAQARPAPHARGDLRLSTIASELARRPVTIRCTGPRGQLLNAAGESGQVEFLDGKPGDVATIERGVCETLHAYSRETKRAGACLLPCAARPLDVAWSLNALAHESYHLAGIRNEALTQCHALDAIPFVARRLGAAPAQALALGAYARAQLPDRMPAEYFPRGC